MRIERIINKAKTLGINTGNGSRAEQIIAIADALGLDDENLDLIEKSLDEMLDQNEEFLDTNNFHEENNNYSKNVNKRNIKDKNEESESLKKASNERTQNKVKTAQDKINNLNSNKNKLEETEEKVQDASKKINTVRKIGKKGVNAALSIGRATAKGASSLVTWIMANPYLVGAIAIVVLILLVVLMFVATDKDFSNGYFDSACNYNLTRVNYISETNPANVNIKDFVIGSVYAYSKEYALSDSAKMALMIAIKTNTLAVGNYNSTTKSVSATDSTLYEAVSGEEKQELEKLYSKIERYLFISESYKDNITSLSAASSLNISPEYIQKFAEAGNSNYKSILKDIYMPNGSNNSNVVENNISRTNLFVGDSRTVGMEASVNELNSNNTVAQGSMRYDWFVSTAIPWVNGKIESTNESYNIISWMGLNDLGEKDYTGVNAAQKYYEKYKELAQGSWSNQMIYVVSLGPVKDEQTYYVDMAAVDAFNLKLRELIASSGINNLHFLDLNLGISDITYYDDEGIHYNTENYQKIYNIIISSLTSGGISGDLALYDMGDYCEFHYNEGNGCNIGWWYPIGSAEPTSGNIYGGEPMAQIDYEDSFCLTPNCRPNVGVSDRHYGNDLYASIGDNIIATRAGTVLIASDAGCENHYNCGGCICSANGSGFGNYVSIDHGDGLVSYYGHLSPGTIVVKQGQYVEQGQLLGKAGSSGSSTGPHLHFEMRLNGQPVDPYNYVDPNNPRPGSSGCTGSYDADIYGVCNALKDKGLSDISVAALLGNMYVESAGTFDPSLNAPDGGTGRSYGLVMWHNQAACANYSACSYPKTGSFFCNASDMQCYCQNNGMSWDTVECQVDYLLNQINNNKRYSDVVYGNQDVKNMANSFCSTFEVASDCYQGKWSTVRTNKAAEYLPMVQNGCRD